MRSHTLIYRRLVSLSGILLLVMLIVTGCIYDSDQYADVDPSGQVTLLLATNSTVTSDGEDPYNENVIHNVHLFFYPVDSSDTTPAAFHYAENGINKARKHQISLRLDADKRAAIFGSKTNCRVFAVINLPQGVSISETASVSQIKNTVVVADFRAYSENSELNQIQNDFVMFGESTDVKFDSDSKNVYGEVPLIRTAAKIRLALSIEEEIEDADPNDPDQQKKQWEPLISGMRVYITNGVRMAHVTGNEFSHEDLEKNIDSQGNGYYKISASGGDDNTSSDYSTLAREVTSHDRDTIAAMDGMDEEHPYWHNIPLYSYPHSWESTPSEDRQTYLVLQVPWRAKSNDAIEQQYKTFFYQVPINLRGGTVSETDDDGNETLRTIEENTIESNMYYLVKLHIGMLGSFNPEEPLNVEAAYYVVPWQDEIIEAELRDNRYLVVNQTEWSMNNIADLDIPFYTSHETVVARVKFRFLNFNPPKGTYTDDGETYDITYDGSPLRRTVTWQMKRDANDQDAEKISAIYNASTYFNTATNKTEPIFDWSIDNTNYLIHYHHDMIRWDEYTTTSQGGEIKVFGTNSNGINGFYGTYNGETKYLKRTDMTNWSVITAEITIIHKDLFEQGNLDNTRFQHTIYITQYPPMYIEAFRSNVNTSGDFAKYVFVNGNQSYISTSELWKSVADIETSTNQNPNMYVVSISQLDDPSYQIGDPRILTVNNNLSNDSFNSNPGQYDNPNNTWYYETWFGNPTAGSAYGTIYSQLDETSAGKGDFTRVTFNWTTQAPVSATAKYGSSPRQLKYYYPTDEATGVGSKENFVAPKLRIASSYGSIMGRTGIEMARRRCATYQEQGCPAGRWRLPTQAEIRFINELSTAGRIPMLFSRYGAQAVSEGKLIYHDDGSPYYNYPHYWCAQGAAYIDDSDGQVKINKGATETTGKAAQVAVRCVYDEWYWQKEDGTEDVASNNGVFTWGDKEKQSPQN